MLIKRNKSISLRKDREYITAENYAYGELIKAGYLPSGRTNDFEKVVVFKILNRHTNDEKKDVFYFNDWQEASESLCKEENKNV